MRGAGDWHQNWKMMALKALLSIIVLAMFILGLYVIGRRDETDGRQVRGSLQSKMHDVRRVTYEGAVYEPKALSTVLVMGVDNNKNYKTSGFRSGGQVDLLLVLLIDNKNEEIIPLQIDRDTMTEITVLGVLGGKAGTRNAQICLSHGFGDGNAESCLLTREAVSNLLLGIEIDYYFAIDLDGIQALNDVIGGVTVTLSDDLSALDPNMRKGETLTLHGKQAEYFVRNRRDVGSGTNEGRMDRQKSYLDGLRIKIRSLVQYDQDVIVGLYDTLKPYLQTNMTRGRIINMIWKTRDYHYADVVRAEGRYSIGEDGFMEFRIDGEALQRLVINLFYQKIA